jgi:hypothetical protein
VHFFFHEKPATGATALPLIEEEAEMGTFDGGIEVGVGKNDIRAFTTQFEADSLEVAARGGFHDQPACCVFTGKRHLVDIHMAG